MKRIWIGAACLAAAAATGSAFAATQVLAPKKITVSATEYAYKFSTTKTARKNQKVVITLVNKGTEVHDLKFIGVTPKAKFIPAGGRTTFTVVFKRTGRFQYVCTIGEHAIKGMQGIFVVKP